METLRPTRKFVILVWLPSSLRPWATLLKDMTFIAFILRMHCPKGISQFTPSYWTHMCTLLGKMQHVLPIFGWPNTWIAVACLAPCSLRRPEFGTAVMESGRTFTFIALARLASPINGTSTCGHIKKKKKKKEPPSANLVEQLASSWLLFDPSIRIWHPTGNKYYYILLLWHFINGHHLKPPLRGCTPYLDIMKQAYWEKNLFCLFF